MISDYPGLLDEALQEVPFCYQLFYPNGTRFVEELGCIADQLENDIQTLVASYERLLRREFEKDKIRQLKKIHYELLPPEDKQRQVFEVNRINRQRMKQRKNYYKIGSETSLDTDLLVVGSKLIFSGMALNIIRQGEQTDAQNVILAVTDEEFLSDYLSQLREFTESSMVIMLIKDCWQFNIRQLQDQYRDLPHYSIVADEFGIFDRISRVCGRNNCLVKVKDGKIVKVVATVKDLLETDEEKADEEAKQARAEQEKQEEAKAEESRKMFRNVDTEEIGLISFDIIMEECGKQYEDLLLLADKDGSNALDEDEFVDFRAMIGAQ